MQNNARSTTVAVAAPTDDVKLLTAKEVAELLGVHVRSIWRLSATGEIPAPIRLGERVVRWRLCDLRDHFHSKAAGGPGVRR
ncbi:MAG: helix-turn-helix domain-containing protein [Phycisphaerales bacterium]|jgi:excisionase family DNA binding protein|nr:helix-turn-helix domain-containing protein [Phycisphaerales bacterium]